jgi:predicted nucleic acid-binding protein
VLSEFYYNATRKLSPSVPPEDAWARVRTYLVWDPLPVDATLLRRAREVEERWRLSWWDSLIVGAAQLQNCEILLTEDLQDGATFDMVTVRSPFTFAAEAPRVTYTVTPPARAERHRPRGRPRHSAVTG